MVALAAHRSCTTVGEAAGEGRECRQHCSPTPTIEAHLTGSGFKQQLRGWLTQLPPTCSASASRMPRVPPATATSNSAPPQLPGKRCTTVGALGAAAGSAYACFCAAQNASMTRRNWRGSAGQTFGTFVRV